MWHRVDFADLDAGVWPAGPDDYEQWMCRPAGEKYPVSPWTPHNAPAPCSHTTCIEHGDDTDDTTIATCDDCQIHRDGDTTTADCGHSARYKWGWDGNYRGFEKAKMTALEADVGGLVFIQREADPFVFVDGDDVRDPETGDVHPGFIAILDRLGQSYADVSTSGAGLHVYYRGDLPGEQTQAKWQLDDEPWGSNDELPAVEIYSGKHVCLATGDHVAGTPPDVRPWDAEALQDLLEDVGEDDDGHSSLDEFDGGADGAESGEGDAGDDAGRGSSQSPADHVAALDAQDVAEKTIVDTWNGSASTSDGEQAFIPTWGSPSDNGTANIVNSDFWVDTGDHGGSGGPIEMAAIDLGILDERHAEPGAVTGEDWWQAYEHLQDEGFDLPDRDGDQQHSDYYDAPLGDLVDGDPWSDPGAMLEACLQARARGLVDDDADPPTLALIPLAEEIVGDTEVGDGTREMLAGVFHEELNVTSVDDGQLVADL